jgi:hypothetical protein
MVVYTNTSATSPKRRRLDKEAVRTAQQVADTNATLQMFTNKRPQSKWMHTATAGEGATPSAPSSANVTASPGDCNPPGRHETLGSRPQQTKASSNGLPPLNVNTLVATQAHAPNPKPALVDYESPITTQMPTPLTAAAALMSRPPSVSGPQPGLPSPAPSDEHANSPVTATFISVSPNQSHVPVKRRGPGRPRKHPVPASNTPSNLSPVQSPAVTSRLITMPNAPSQLPSTMRFPTQTSSFASAARRVNSLSDAATPPQGMVQHGSHSRGLFDTNRLRQRLGECRTFNAVDEGRKALAQEAMEKQDHFYLILSQLFCLHTCAPGLLPRHLDTVDASSWQCLERLLCPNQAVTPTVVQWFAEFPAPLHMVLESGDREFFINQLGIIESFLQVLPRRWDIIIEISKRTLAPPLTQDLIEQLYLISPVLQTTSFRAIARVFWGEDNPGLRFLESLHAVDQHTYAHQMWRRNEGEKRIAYDIYSQVYHAWRSSVMSGKAFAPPPACNYFHIQPQSMGTPINITATCDQSAARQRQLMQTNDHMLAQQQQQQVSEPAAAQHGLRMQGNNRTTLRHQTLAPSLLQHLYYQPDPAGQQISSPYSPAAPGNRSSAPAPAHIVPSSPQHHTPNNMAPALSRLLPPENALPRALPVQPDTNRVSLHQALLRSPIPASEQLHTIEQPLYRHVRGYALRPTKLDPTLCAQQIVIPMNDDQMKNVPTTVPTLPGEPGARILNSGSILYRLRCSKMPAGKGFDSESLWVTAENVWPDHLSFELNGKHLEARRKLHHGRYLPVDLSSTLRVGTNMLSVYALPFKGDPTIYVVAIEAIRVSTHTTIVAAVPTIPSEASLNSIKRSLGSPSDPDDDDDFIMTSSTLTIPIFDPYRADRICDDPVRGATCLHRECFDLETFLSQCKREQPGFPCVPDCWRCPICKGDVRPQKLVRDGFLLHVREELEKKGLLSTRAIVVDADGTWKPRVEEASGIRSPSLEREEEAAAAAAMNGVGKGKGKQKVVEIIELD